ncbi:putative bifunctional diguanylate cyclase/phosphodiesterase [Aestuariibius sp. HNIBRBA575]|uniref:putative bifunctional diguanylate cyclase/phosphodiesterase n=1 Tax=Aestuariibius sp. HNIBRBA575 TaxID=3233343 RepID=UPI0034A36EF2
MKVKPTKSELKLSLLGYGLARKLAAIFGVMISVFVIAVIFFNVQTQVELVRERLDLRSQQLLRLGLEVSMPYLIEGRPGELEAIFEEISNQPDVERFYLLDEYGTLLVDGSDVEIGGFLAEIDDPLARQAFDQKEQIRIVADNIESIAHPIVLGHNTYGTMRLDVRLDTLRNEIRTVWVRNAILGGVFIFLGMTISIILARRLTEPLIHLTQVTERAAAGDLNQTIDVQTNDEIESLAHSFETMLVTMRGSIQQIHRLAYIDKLTEIPNRAWFSDQLERVTVAAAMRGERFAIMFLDVDNFKTINDRHGHHVGDALLVALSKRLTHCVTDLGLEAATIDQPRGLTQTSALIARLGGDEFTLILPERYAERVAIGIVNSMKVPVDTKQVSITVTTSIGVGVFPVHARSANDLLKVADAAMYQAKQAGQNCYQYYDEKLHEELLSVSQIQNELRTAIEEEQFVLYLQPQFDVKTGDVSGAEALVRWNHPEKGLLTPDVFLPVAASSGLLPFIGREITRLAISIAKDIQAIAHKDFVLAINLSVEELLEPDFVSDLVDLIHQTGVDPSGLEIEITENTAMFDNDAAVFNIDLLRSIGVRLAIDDFGVGFSNLARLKNLAFDTLKIDKSLLPGMNGRSDAKKLFNTILELSRVVDANVVAEGIETQEQLAFLRTTHCQNFQGYLGGRPVTAGDFIVWLNRQSNCSFTNVV